MEEKMTNLGVVNEYAISRWHMLGSELAMERGGKQVSTLK